MDEKNTWLNSDAALSDDDDDKERLLAGTGHGKDSTRGGFNFGVERSIFFIY